MRPLARSARLAWTRPFVFLTLHALCQLALLRRVFREGALADIDSIAHVSYLRYFVDEFVPATASSFGYTPKYNLGAPFLLYNVPPGTCLAGAALVRLGLSAESAIKAPLV